MRNADKETEKILQDCAKEIYSFVSTKLDRLQQELELQVDLNISTTTNSEIGNPVTTTVVGHVELEAVLNGRAGYYS